MHSDFKFPDIESFYQFLNNVGPIVRTYILHAT